MRRFAGHEFQRRLEADEGEDSETSQGAGVGSSLSSTTQFSSHAPEGVGGQLNANIEQLMAAQQDYPDRTATAETSGATPRNNVVGADFPSESSARNFEYLRKLQVNVPSITEGQPREPKQSDFPQLASFCVLQAAIDKPLQYCIVLLHHLGHNEKSLEPLARRIQQQFPPDCFFLLLRAPRGFSNGNQGYDWSYGPEDGLFKSSRHLLEDIILNGLIKSCCFRPRNIVILGHGQGAQVALTAATTWNAIEFGGIMSIGGSLPAYMRLPEGIKAKTPALLIKGLAGRITPQEVLLMKRNLPYVDTENRPGDDENTPSGSSPETTQPYLEFLVHRLRREEWNKRAVISFDGGGVRGYGSLLILRDLMEKIAQEERRWDSTIKSSFAPCVYKPTTRSNSDCGHGDDRSTHSEGSQDSGTGSIVATACDDLPDSSRFLPCHYFTYAAGTSTGGLISIMLQRFRMTVDECIEEYATLGEKVFGRKRPSLFGILRPKFDHEVLKRVIQDVTRRRGEVPVFGEVDYAMNAADDDMCKCLVLAISDQSSADKPYHFRTYRTPDPKKSSSRGAGYVQKSKNYGPPSKIPIWQVARATSAAPTYFAPIDITSGDGKTVHRFKDGGFGCNNPSYMMFEDVLHMHDELESNLGPFVSIGTGELDLKHTSTKSNLRDQIANERIARKLVTRTGPAHSQMLKHATRDGREVFPYYRFDGGKLLGEVALDEWKTHKATRITGRPSERGSKTLETIALAINAFLGDSKVTTRLQELAEILVKRRRLQTRDASEWDRYATFSFYECDLKGCEKERIKTANKFREHLKLAHDLMLQVEVIDEKIRQCRKCDWLYRDEKQMPQT